VADGGEVGDGAGVVALGVVAVSVDVAGVVAVGVVAVGVEVGGVVSVGEGAVGVGAAPVREVTTRRPTGSRR
jgi:hypothetical protein